MTESGTQKAVPKRIAIIGAGCSGLAAIKCCLEEGLEPICLEKSHTIGGLWNYSEAAQPGSASIYKSLVINTSKDMMMFSDFPAPDNFPPFLTHTKVMEYFKLYADNFKLLKHIVFNATVLHIKKAENYEQTGEWCVRYSRKTTEKDDDANLCETYEETFQGVMVCTGHHSVPYVPKIDGLGLFGGSVLHSHSYKSPEKFVDKTVVIVGLGNSAADIACDLAKTAKKVYLCSRRGAWIVPRTAFWGLPADMLANSRLVFTMPYSILDWCVQKQANFRVDHQTYGLRPNHGVLNCHPSINDELPIHLVNGRIGIKVNIKRVEREGVLLDDDTFLPCDVIILATGYDYRLDFISSDVLKAKTVSQCEQESLWFSSDPQNCQRSLYGDLSVVIENNCTELFQYIFPPRLSHPTMAVIGLIQAIGAVMPISEIQSRWFARVMTGASRLPPPEVMLNDIRVKRSAMDALYVKSRRHTMQTFWIEYMDTIASYIDARPNLRRMLLTDPELAIKCYLGPCFPAQYRLNGPGKWPGARKFIVSAMSRAFRPKENPRRNNLEEINKGCITDSSSEDQTDTTFTAHDTVSDQGLSQTGSRPRNGVLNSITTCESRTGQHRWFPEWMTMTFYFALISFCCLVWVLTDLLDRTENVLSFFGQTVGRNLPLSD